MWNQFGSRHKQAGYLDKEVGHEEGGSWLTLGNELLGVRAGLSPGSTVWWPETDNRESKEWDSQHHNRDLKITEENTHFCAFSYFY